MAFFYGLFSLITVIAVFAFIIGLIKPSVFKIKGKPLNRKTASLYTWGIAIVASLLSSLTMSDEQKAEEKVQQEQYIANKNAEEQAKKVPQVVTSEKSPNLPPKEFKENMVTHCMRSAGVDVDNPNDNVSMGQLAEIEKCLGN
jgi:ABC-type Na+ efflux pump permease subunit